MKLLEKSEEYFKKHKYQAFLVIAFGAQSVLSRDLNNPFELATVGTLALFAQFVGGIYLKNLLKLEEEKDNKKSAFLILGGAAIAITGYLTGLHSVAQIGMTGVVAGGIDVVKKEDEEVEKKKNKI